MSTSVQALYQMTATTTQFVPTLKVLSYADASMVILEMAQIAQVNNLKVLCFNFITVYVVIQFYPRFKQIKPFIPNTFTMALQQKRGNLIHFELRTKNSGESTKEVISRRRKMRTRTSVALTYQIHGYNKKYSDGTAVNEILTKNPVVILTKILTNIRLVILTKIRAKIRVEILTKILANIPIVNLTKTLTKIPVVILSKILLVILTKVLANIPIVIHTNILANIPVVILTKILPKIRIVKLTKILARFPS